MSDRTKREEEQTRVELTKAVGIYLQCLGDKFTLIEVKEKSAEQLGIVAVKGAKSQLEMVVDGLIKALTDRYNIFSVKAISAKALKSLIENANESKALKEVIESRSEEIADKLLTQSEDEGEEVNGAFAQTFDALIGSIEKKGIAENMVERVLDKLRGKSEDKAKAPFEMVPVAMRVLVSMVYNIAALQQHEQKKDAVGEVSPLKKNWREIIGSHLPEIVEKLLFGLTYYVNMLGLGNKRNAPVGALLVIAKEFDTKEIAELAINRFLVWNEENLVIASLVVLRRIFEDINEISGEWKKAVENQLDHFIKKLLVGLKSDSLLMQRISRETLAVILEKVPSKKREEMVTKKILAGIRSGLDILPLQSSLGMLKSIVENTREKETVKAIISGLAMMQSDSNEDIRRFSARALTTIVEMTQDKGKIEAISEVLSKDSAKAGSSGVTLLTSVGTFKSPKIVVLGEDASAPKRNSSFFNRG